MKPGHDENEELSDESQKTRAVFNLGDRFGLEFKTKQSFDCFFYSEQEDDANNLAIDLYNLGYEVDVHRGVKENRWSVIGTTKEMDSSLENVSKWSEEMSKLAKRHRAEFDGWGGEAS